MDLLTIAHPERPALDMALTGDLLRAVAHGSAPETVRVFRPGPTVAFGRLDRTRAGFARASHRALAHGRQPLVRWGGGHAAAYDLGSVVIEVIRRQGHVVGGLEERFLDMVALVQESLGALGVTLERGELQGEYCPGRFSLHLPGGPKVAGVAQRVTARASLTTAVIIASGGDALRDTLADVYQALELPVEIQTAGAVSERRPDLGARDVVRTVLETVTGRYTAATPPGAHRSERQR